MHWEAAWEALATNRAMWATTRQACEVLVRGHPWACLLAEHQVLDAASALASSALDGAGLLTIDQAIAAAQQQRNAA